MTNTAKPTPGPVRFTEVKSNCPAEGYKEGGWHEALWSDGANQPIMVALDQDDHAARFDFPNPKDMDFIQEAYAVYTKTGLTPRQLLEQRDELLNAVEGFIKSFHHSVITDDLEQFPAMAAGISAMNKARGIPEGCIRTFICEHPNWPNGIWQIRPVSSFAKCEKDDIQNCFDCGDGPCTMNCSPALLKYRKDI